MTPGTTDVEGVRVVHLTADFDTARALADLRQAAAQSGQAGQIPNSTAKTISEAVKDTGVDIYTGESDHLLRKLTVTGRFEGSNPSGGQELRGTVRFDLQVSDVNRPQEIRAPRNAVPVSRLGDGPLGSNLTPGSAARPRRAKPARDRGGRGRTGSAGTQRRQRTSQAYVSCVQQAQDLPALDKCQALLP